MFLQIPIIALTMTVCGNHPSVTLDGLLRGSVVTSNAYFAFRYLPSEYYVVLLFPFPFRGGFITLESLGLIQSLLCTQLWHD